MTTAYRKAKKCKNFKGNTQAHVYKRVLSFLWETIGSWACEKKKNRNESLERVYQVTKGARWMPWGRRPMKDVVSDDTLRGAAIKR